MREQKKRRPKGTGSVRELRGRWEASYSFTSAAGARRRRSQLFDTKTNARKWLTQMTADQDRGNGGDAGSLTLGDYLEQWLTSLGMAQLEPTTLSWYRSAVRSHVVPILGRVKLAKLDALTIEAFLADKAARGRLAGKGKAARYAGQPLGPASVRRLQITLHAALDPAVRKGLLARNPADLAARPKLPARDVTIDAWAPEQVAVFLVPPLPIGLPLCGDFKR